MVFASSEVMQEQIRRGLVVFRGDHSKPPFRKAHLRPVSLETENDEPLEDEVEANVGMRVMPSVIYKQSQVAVRYLRDIDVRGKIFDNPKAHEVLARFVRYVTSEGDLVLDFFAGSCKHRRGRSRTQIMRGQAAHESSSWCNCPNQRPRSHQRTKQVMTPSLTSAKNASGVS